MLRDTIAFRYAALLRVNMSINRARRAPSGKAYYWILSVRGALRCLPNHRLEKATRESVLKDQRLCVNFSGTTERFSRGDLFH